MCRRWQTRIGYISREYLITMLPTEHATFFWTKWCTGMMEHTIFSALPHHSILPVNFTILACARMSVLHIPQTCHCVSFYHSKRLLRLRHIQVQSSLIKYSFEDATYDVDEISFPKIEDFSKRCKTMFNVVHSVYWISLMRRKWLLLFFSFQPNV